MNNNSNSSTAAKNIQVFNHVKYNGDIAYVISNSITRHYPIFVFGSDGKNISLVVEENSLTPIPLSQQVFDNCNLESALDEAYYYLKFKDFYLIIWSANNLCEIKIDGASKYKDIVESLHELQNLVNTFSGQPLLHYFPKINLQK